MERKIFYAAGFTVLLLALAFSAGVYIWWKITSDKYEVLILNLEKINEKKFEASLWSFSGKLEEVSTWNLENIPLNSAYDFETDSSIQKFVTSTNSFQDLQYIPENLEKISWEFIIDSKWNQELRKEANKALQEMWKKFFEETWEKIKVVSAYRSYSYQVWIKSRGCPDALCAKPGFSEHQTWLAVDLWSASTEKTWKNDKNLQKYFSWLNENAHNFGFHNTYQKWLEIDGYEVEPWHWRYLWVELASYLRENKMTIKEFYDLEKNKKEA